MSQMEWANNPAIRKIDVRKLSVLMALVNQAEGKQISEMIPIIMAANNNLKAMGLAFTKDEVNLIFDILKKDMSPEELESFNRLNSMINP